MSILNYFFIGAAFTFVMDLILGIKAIQKHPAVKNQEWGMAQRILCIIIWPIAALTFITAFIKQSFK